MAPPKKKTPKDKPRIPYQLLRDWIEERISDFYSLDEVCDEYLWTDKKIEVYRVDAWAERWVEDSLSKYIKYSWFLHYNKKKKLIIDQTIREKSCKS